MLYRIVHWINRWYALWILWMFIGAFLLAASMMFIFPPITLALLFIGLGGLGMAAVCSWILRAIERSLVRRSLHLGICPQCRGINGRTATGSIDEWHCQFCDAAYKPSGELPTRETDDQRESAAM